MKFLRHLFIALIFFSTVSISAQSETEKGIELYRNGDYDQAITVLENVVKANEKDRKAWIYLGISFARKGKDEEALKAFQTVNSINTTKEIGTTISERAKITKRPYIRYSDTARKNHVQGEMIFAVELKADGKIGIIFPIKTLSDGLTENGISAIRSIEFEPAQKNGKPISIVQFFHYRLELY